MRRFPNVVPVLSLALAAGALTLAACSDTGTTTAPSVRPTASGANFSAVVNGNSVQLTSDASTEYCPGSNTLGLYDAFPASAPALSGCVAARDLEADGSLAAYNPGWPQFPGNHWIGFTADGGPSSDYRPTPGLYVFRQTFTMPVLPAGATTPELALDVRSDNVVAVYLNGTKLGQQAVQDCNDGDFGPCNWTSGAQLHVTSTSILPNPQVNTLVFIVNDLPTGFPDLVAPPAGKGGPAPQYGCTTRTPQPTGSHLFTNDNAVTTTAGHVGSAPTGFAMSPAPTLNTPNPTQTGCENPAGLAFGGAVTWTVPLGIWCSPGFWKNHLNAWSTTLQNSFYNANGPYPNNPQTFVGYQFKPQKPGLSNPTMLQVISDPSIYGGPATNNVASFISNQLFGTPMSANPTENCPNPLPAPLNQ